MKKKQTTRDRVILVSDQDQSVCEILDVKEEFGGDLHCDGYILPVSDAGMVKVSEKGRVFFFNGSIPYINEVRHLAEVEANIVVNKALTFKGDVNEQKGPGFFMYFIIAALVAAVIFK